MSTHYFPCTSCGARLEFAPGQQALKCPYCATLNSVSTAEPEAAQAATEELDYQAWLARAAGQEPLLERQTVKCPGCGAASQLAQNLTADRCPFCATPLIAGQAYAQRQIRPRAIAPFHITADEAHASFKKWISSLWFAPNALKRQHRSDSSLKGIYLPYWTYDSDSDTPYTGARGDHYYETETVYVNGQRQTRQVRRTRWTPVAGQVQVSFDDVPVPATTSLPPDWLDGLEPWEMDRLQAYRDDFVSGFVVEAYQTGLEACFERAKSRMEDGIRHAIRRDIGGDEQRILTMHPHFFNISFKHILLPVWLSSYRYDGKTWRFLVNGQSGKVRGERPWSAWKIAFAVLGALLVLGVLFYLGQTQG